MFEELNKSTVYGPVKSWRFGMSLGIDPIFKTSICSFNCVYCQLGQIQKITNKREIFVETQRVVSDYQELLNSETKVDVITFSGSGEPTLAKNFGEISKEIKKLSPSIPHYILSNGTLLGDADVIKDLMLFDKVTVKLDACNEKDFQAINRPSKELSFDKVWENMVKFRSVYNGNFEIQIMLMPNLGKLEIEDLSKRLSALRPDLVQINTPKRPYPLSWHRENRGNHENQFDYKVSQLKTMSKEDAETIVSKLKENTGLNFQIFS